VVGHEEGEGRVGGRERVGLSTSLFTASAVWFWSSSALSDLSVQARLDDDEEPCASSPSDGHLLRLEIERICESSVYLRLSRSFAQIGRRRTRQYAAEMRTASTEQAKS